MLLKEIEVRKNKTGSICSEAFKEYSDRIINLKAVDSEGNTRWFVSTRYTNNCLTLPKRIQGMGEVKFYINDYRKGRDVRYTADVLPSGNHRGVYVYVPHKVLRLWESNALVDIYIVNGVGKKHIATISLWDFTRTFEWIPKRVLEKLKISVGDEVDVILEAHEVSYYGTNRPKSRRIRWSSEIPAHSLPHERHKKVDVLILNKKDIENRKIKVGDFLLLRMESDCGRQMWQLTEVKEYDQRKVRLLLSIPLKRKPDTIRVKKVRKNHDVETFIPYTIRKTNQPPKNKIYLATTYSEPHTDFLGLENKAVGVVCSDEMGCFRTKFFKTAVRRPFNGLTLVEHTQKLGVSLHYAGKPYMLVSVHMGERKDDGGKLYILPHLSPEQEAHGESPVLQETIP